MKKFTFKQNLLTALTAFAVVCLLSTCKKDSSKSAPVNNTPTQAPAVTVSTIAGQIMGEPPVGGSANGMGTAATFSQPFAMAVDGAGNLYVTDSFNNLIREITPAAVVTTFAGNGVSGYMDGPASTAEFGLAYGIATDKAGNVYVTDTYNFVIRKITAAGVVSTFAGNRAGGGGSTYKDGTGASATFQFPWGITADASDNLYIADKFAIRKITPDGVVTTLAGSGAPGSANGAGASAGFKGLTGITADQQGNIYVNDSGNYSVRKITSSGTVSTLAGKGSPGTSDGIAGNATFTAPGGIAVDAKGNTYVTDGSTIRMISPAGAVVTIAGNTTASGGQATNGTGKLATFNGPQGIVAGSNGELYVTDTDDNLIRKIVFK